ncbi:MAG: 3-deoxy-8-phosphooctulonate synthase [Planctomycetota bacterium]|jgi:2-dehydro-3-deoxyphosphooctonate aldolase (KDO 8-P synthase)|nr:3-deoxy-8-phosphooctulonate synthase [Planctomycetota bacterium]HBO51029.1 3-deoxy-8-phosphooctulonate synthase [Planctomycetota bacterium]
MSHLAPETPLITSGSLAVGAKSPPLIIAGPDSLESEELALTIATELVRLQDKLQVPFVFKGSYDKANRSSHLSYRGPGIETGLSILSRVKQETGLPVTTDVHSTEEVSQAAEVLDILQVPAFLCRQNDLLQACGATGKIVNIKKGQFLDPANIPARAAAATGPGTPGVLITERGTTFGHGDLVNDFRGIPIMREGGFCVIFDATHSVQKPGALGDRSDGKREMIPHLARAAAGTGCDGFFFEVHPEPDEALCDGPNSLRLDQFEALLCQVIEIDRIARQL